MPKPLVNILMLTYNHEDTIGQAIEGILEQKTEFPFELIIGEDCSTDRTREIILDYQKEHPEIIRLITSDKNVGMLENDRRIFKAASAKYIAFCEGDDYWCDPEKLQKQITLMEADPSISLCFHNVYFLFGDEIRMYKQFQWRFRDKFCSAGEVIYKGGEFCKVISAVTRRQIYMDLPDWYFQAPVGDWAICLLAALKGKVYYMNNAMAVYRCNFLNSWSQTMYNDAILYKDHLFKSIKTRKMANDASNNQYRRYFGRRIGKDIQWLLLFDLLTTEEFRFLQDEYFNLLSTYRKNLILMLRTLKIEKFISILRKLKKAVFGIR